MDLDYENHGSIVLVRPTSDAGRAWIDENTETEGWQWIGGALAVEPRYAGDLLFGAQSEGLELAQGGRACKLVQS